MAVGTSDGKYYEDEFDHAVQTYQSTKTAEVAAPDYDYEGWKAANPDTVMGEGQHYPDTYKLPNHPTFSNESIYHGKEGAEGGQWGKNPDGTWNFTPGKTNLEHHTPDALKDYFNRVEPGNNLILPEKKSDATPDNIQAGQQFASMYRPDPTSFNVDPLSNEIERAAGSGIVARGGSGPVTAGARAAQTRAKGAYGSASEIPQERINKLKLEEKDLESKHGIRRFAFVDPESGRSVGNVSLTPRGKDVYVNMVDAWTLGGPNTMGPSAMRNILRQIKEAFPESERLYGFRVSGARGENNTRANSFIPLKKGISTEEDTKAATAKAVAQKDSPAPAGWTQIEGGVERQPSSANSEAILRELSDAVRGVTPTTNLVPPRVREDFVQRSRGAQSPTFLETLQSLDRASPVSTAFANSIIDYRRVLQQLHGDLPKAVRNRDVHSMTRQEANDFFDHLTRNYSGGRQR